MTVKQLLLNWVAFFLGNYESESSCTYCLYMIQIVSLCNFVTSQAYHTVHVFSAKSCVLWNKKIALH